MAVELKDGRIIRYVKRIVDIGNGFLRVEVETPNGKIRPIRIHRSEIKEAKEAKIRKRTMKREYMAQLSGLSATVSRPPREETHFVEATNDKEALRKVGELIEKLAARDKSWVWQLDVLVAPDGNIIWRMQLAEEEFAVLREGL